MPKGTKRQEMPNESITIVNCHLCDYRVTRKAKIPVLRKYLKLHYKAEHKIILTDDDIANFAKYIDKSFRSELGNVEGLLLKSHNQAIEDIKNKNTACPLNM